MTEEQREQLINALAGWVLDVCKYASTDKVCIPVLPKS